MTNRDTAGFGRRDVLKATGAAAATAGLGGVAGAAGGNCSEETSKTYSGTVADGEGVTHSYAPQTADPCRIRLELSGEGGTDFDLYVTLDGRDPSTDDFDRRSWSYGSQEVVTLRKSALSSDTELGILVDSYSGSGEYELAATERGAGERRGGESQRFRIRIENTAPTDFYPSDASTGGAVWITPGAYATHAGRSPIFREGKAASEGLEAVAEAGRPGGTPENRGLVSELGEAGSVFDSGAFTPADTVEDPNDPKGEVPGAPPIAPGGAFEFEVEATPGAGDRFSFASMFVPSNDVFFATDEEGIPLFDRHGDPVSGDASDWVSLYDAGTEPNGRPGFDEDGAPLQSNPDQGDDEGGVVRPLAEVDDGYDYPAASDAVSVTVEPVEPVETTPMTVRIENTAPADFYSSDASTGGAVWITPGAYGLHGGRNPIFTEGEPASEGLEAIAEAGRPGGTPENRGLLDELQSDDAVLSAGAFTPENTVADPNDPKGEVPGAPPIAPGGAFEFEVEAAPGDGERLSFASMFVPSNDAFFAPGEGGIPLFEDGNPVVGDVTDRIGLYDAGTEPNQKPGFGSDTAPIQSSPDQGADEDGVVRPLSEVEDGYDYPAVSDAISVKVYPSDRTAFRVRIENVAPADFYPKDSATGGAILVTPGAYAVHEDESPIFAQWMEASEGLEAIAEAGRPGGTPENRGLVSELAAEDSVVTSGAFTPADTVADPNDPKGSVPGIPPIAPGGAYEFTVTGAPGERFSFASMFVPSNDVFFAPYTNGIPLFDRNDEPISGDVSRWMGLWDAGTEPNGRPGFGENQAPLQSSPDQGDDENGLVRHLYYVDDGYDYPAADEAIRVTIEPANRN